MQVERMQFQGKSYTQVIVLAHVCALVSMVSSKHILQVTVFKILSSSRYALGFEVITIMSKVWGHSHSIQCSQSQPLHLGSGHIECLELLTVNLGFGVCTNVGGIH